MYKLGLSHRMCKKNKNLFMILGLHDDFGKNIAHVKTWR
jgi:hypothetical protein